MCDFDAFLMAGAPQRGNDGPVPRGQLRIYLGAAQNQQKLLYGVVDEFRWYSRALDAGEVAELYRVSQ